MIRNPIYTVLGLTVLVAAFLKPKSGQMPAEAGPSQGSIAPEVWESIKKLDIKLISDFVTLILKIACGLGGLLLVAYAAKEHFFYDLSSLAAASLLLLVAFAFFFLVAVATGYAVLSIIWFPTLVFKIVSRVARVRGHQLKVRLRPAVARWYVQGFSIFLFLLLLVDFVAARRIIRFLAVWDG